MKKELLTIAEAAKALGRHENTVRNWIASGRLKAVRVGWSYVIAAEAITEAKRAKGRSR